MTTADQTADRADQTPRRRLALVRGARRVFRTKRPVRVAVPAPDQTPATPKPDRGPSIWARTRTRAADRRAARRAKADQNRQVVSAGKFAHVLLVVFGLGLLGVIAGGFLVGYFNVVDTLVRVVHVGDPRVVVAGAGIPRTFIDPAADVPLLAYIGAGVIELASTLTAIATVLLRAAPWRVRLYAWAMFTGVLSSSVWAGIEHAKSRGYPVEAGYFSGMWPLLVAASVHLFTVVRRHVFDPIAAARQTSQIAAAAQTQTVPTPIQQTVAPVQTPEPSPATAHRPKQTSAPKQTTKPDPLPEVRSIVGADDAETLRIIRNAVPTGLPSLGAIKTALKEEGQTCGQTKAIRLQGLLKLEADRAQTTDPEPAVVAAAN